ncbi:MAG TPA: EamA family transporter [Tepidisphaeraceae bacterium]|jgi:transporter family protein|nr:EamA family transporter [Tepidisphaeraceae bacterium]
MFEQRWLIYALLSAVCAAFVPIFGKVGMKDINDTLATGVRSIIMTLFLISLCTFTGVWSKLHTITARPLTMIALSGLAGATSWLFYFKALRFGEPTQVAPIDKMSVPFAAILAFLLLRDRPTALNWAGIIIIAIGAYLAGLPRST